MGVVEGKHYWRGEMLTVAELYAKGANDEHERSSRANRASVQSVTDQIKGMILGAKTEDDKREPTWWPYFTRAAAHIVHDPSGAPAGSGQVEITPETAWEPAFTEAWIAAAMPVLQYTSLIEAQPGQPMPKLPYLSTAPTAGSRAGEKVDVYSKAFDITDAVAATIDAGLMLNISQMVVEMGFMPLTNLLMKAAVASEASSQVSQAVETAAGTGGMANFTGGRYVPRVVVVPPVNVPTLNAANYVAAGMSVVIDPHVTKTLVVDPAAVIGWFRQGRIEQAEPSAFGTGVAAMASGQVAVDSAGVAALTTP